MSDNPQYGLPGAIALPRIRALRLAGGDAVAFAQAQFMNDVAALEPGTWHWNGWLDPKGRVQALFALLREDADRLLLVTPADTDALAAALRRYVFRSKVSLESVALHATGRLASPDQASGSRFARTDGGTIEIDLGGEAGARTLLLDDAPSGQPTGAADADAWWALDIAHGWPALPDARLDAFTPQQLSLQRLAAFSVKKGCYPGQEIVARTHFLGRAKRGIARFSAPDATPGASVQDAEGRDVGHVVCAAAGECLAVVPLDAAAGPFLSGGAPLSPLPLSDGLAR
jgi:folate-binding protein YgfZ